MVIVAFHELDAERASERRADQTLPRACDAHDDVDVVAHPILIRGSHRRVVQSVAGIGGILPPLGASDSANRRTPISARRESRGSEILIAIKISDPLVLGPVS